MIINDDTELALRAAINVLRDSIESGRMPSGIKLEPKARARHAAAITAFERSLASATDQEAAGDATLHRLCGEWWRLDCLPGDEYDDAASEALVNAMHMIASTPARTRDGMRAKARIIEAHYTVNGEYDGNAMVGSLIRDILGG